MSFQSVRIGHQNIADNDSAVCIKPEIDSQENDDCESEPVLCTEGTSALKITLRYINYYSKTMLTDVFVKC